MLFRRLLVGAAVFCAMAGVGPTLADDWVATKLRGGVFAFSNGGWVQLQRGDVVPDGMVVRTTPTGRVTLTRGRESVAVGPETQTQILDRDGEQFTTVKQWYGTVEVDAEARNVQHFQVVNPLLAAVVKGTKFVVTAGENEAGVDVKRGHVEVHDTASADVVTVDAGQSVTVAAGGAAPMEVEETAGPPEPPASIGNSDANQPSPVIPEPPADLIADWEAADEGTPTTGSTDQSYRNHPYYSYWHEYFEHHHGHHGHGGHGGGDD